MNPSTQLLTEIDTHEEYNWSLSWLRSMRVKGGGVPFIKCGRNVRYRREDIEAYILANRVTSTTEAQNV